MDVDDERQKFAIIRGFAGMNPSEKKRVLAALSDVAERGVPMDVAFRRLGLPGTPPANLPHRPGVPPAS